MNKIKIIIDNKICGITSIVNIGNTFYMCLLENGKQFEGNVIKLDDDGEILGRSKGSGTSIFISDKNELVVYDGGYQFYLDPNTLDVKSSLWVK